MELPKCFFAMIFLVGSTTSVAQDNDAASESLMLEEIIVTATRRDSSLQQTSSSVGVLTERIIEDSGVLHIYDYWRMVPSLSVTDRGFAGNRFTIRGMSGSSGNENDEALTANYVDDTLLPSPQALFTHAPSFRLVDVERVEVLRGPQGTLFGAGSMGGTIRMITNKANVSSSTQSYEAMLSSTAHGGTNFGVTAVLNMPLTKERSALRLAAYHFDDDGFIDDVGSGENNANGNTTTGFRLGGTAYFKNAFSMSGKIIYQDEDADSFAYIDPNGKPSLGLDITGDYQTALLVDDYRSEETVLYNLNFDYASSIGNLTSATSYVNSETELVLDLSVEMRSIFGALSQAWWDGDSSQEALMQEFRLASDSGGKVDWLVGAYYADMKFERSSIVPAPDIDTICGDCTGGTGVLLQGVTDDDRKETGLFADVSFRLTDRLTANVGARWYDMSRRATETSTGFFADPTAPVSTREFDDDGINGKGSLSLRLNDDVMFYWLVSEGFRAGGVNELGAAAACNVSQTFGPDSVVNYEMGTKTQFLAKRLTVNGSIYRAKWSDAQLLVVPGTCFFSVAFNSGGVTVDGLEIETSYLPNEHWELTANAGYTDPTLDNDVPDLGAPAGRRLAFVPDITVSLSSTYRFDAFADSNGFARADFQHVGSSYNEIGDLAFGARSEQPSYNLVNFRIGLETDRWRVTLFADNVFDEQAVIRCCRDNGEFTTNRSLTIGIRARFNSW